MDKISKALRKLSPREREQARLILLKLNSGKLDGLDIKKLKGRDDIYRVRKGNVRIIYQKSKDRVGILSIQRRNDTTYNF